MAFLVNVSKNKSDKGRNYNAKMSLQRVDVFYAMLSKLLHIRRFAASHENMQLACMLFNSRLVALLYCVYNMPMFLNPVTFSSLHRCDF